MTWTTITNFIDNETGEALTIRHLEQQLYDKLKTYIKYKINKKDYGTRYVTHVCEKNRQTKLF